MEFAKKKISELIPADYNPRKALKKGDREYEKIRRSIEQFGFVEPVVWNKRTERIVGGHQRVTVLKDSGETEVDCVVVDLPEEKEKALNIALNKITGEWDEEKLAGLIAELQAEDFDVSLTGFDEKEITSLMASLDGGDVQEDGFDVDAELEKPVFSKYGDVWTLGEHRLMCGDSTKKEDMERLCSQKSIDLYLTDPPYNVAIGEKGKLYKKLGMNKKAKGQSYGSTDRSILNDDMSDEDFRKFLKSTFETADSFLKDGSSFYIFHADSEGYNFRGACRDTGWKVRQCLVWKKDSLVVGRQDYQWIHEPILYGWKDGGSHVWYSDRKQTTVLEFDRPKRSDLHPTMKSLPLLGYLIQNSSKDGDWVLDSFGGSGSTLIACQQLKRRCFTMELDPKYADVIAKRYIELVGSADNVKCERDGLEYSFDEIAGDTEQSTSET